MDDSDAVDEAEASREAAIDQARRQSEDFILSLNGAQPYSADEDYSFGVGELIGSKRQLLKWGTFPETGTTAYISIDHVSVVNFDPSTGMLYVRVGDSVESTDDVEVIANFWNEWEVIE